MQTFKKHECFDSNPRFIVDFTMIFKFISMCDDERLLIMHVYLKFVIIVYSVSIAKSDLHMTV